ncbi:MAG: hypothetical protein EOO15_06055 [Chitinophagaceae bacterium]|nr:MAG: hypothetical protein EOO15_06055 [Chitinophagaceae bacterium]
MLTYNERIELRGKLKNGEIEVESALEIFWNGFKEGQLSWHTKDWKERRAQILKDQCEICGSKDTLTVQHRSHPQKFSDYLRDVTREYTKERIDRGTEINKGEFSRYVRGKYDYIPVLFCPFCKNSNPSKRVRKTPQYRCPSCRHEFDTPDYLALEELISIFYDNEEAIEVRDKCFVSKDKWRNKQNLSGIRYWFQREHAKNIDEAAIKKEAFLRYLDDDIKYLSFEDTITACKRCASSYDLHGKDLCPQCKVNYKGIQYPTCIDCLPDEKRKAALESIAFGIEWQKMHKDLGID